MAYNSFATHKRANQDWNPCLADGSVATWEQAQILVLMDIRAELQKLNAVFACQNFLDVPTLLRAIKKNTTKPRKTRKATR